MGLLVGGGVLIHRMHLERSIFQSENAQGIIVANEAYPQSGSRTLPYPSYQAIVKFIDRHGEVVIFADSVGF